MPTKSAKLSVYISWHSYRGGRNRDLVEARLPLPPSRERQKRAKSAVRHRSQAPARAHDLSYKSSVLYCSAHTKDWTVGCPPFGAVAAAQGRFTVRTSARGMSRAVFSPPQGESANRTYKGSGTLNTVSLPAAQRDCKSSAAKIKSTNTERKPNHMLTKHFNQTIVVHILRDMFLNPTCRKEESVCRTRS